MKISNETKVGVLTITALTILILGFNFLKGNNILKKSRKIYAVFNDLGSLSTSNEVKINGYVIGNVSKLDVKDKDMSGIVATINLKEDVNIPRDSKALISSPLVGASYIVIEKGESTSFLKPGDTLTTRVDIGILDDVKAQLTPTLTKVRSTLDSLNSVFGKITGVLNNDTKRNLQETIANLNSASSSLNGLLDNQTGPLARTLQSTSEITDAIKKNTASIDTIVTNSKTASKKLADLQLQPAIDSLSALITQLRSTATKISGNNGTLGALINDKSVYNKLYDAILGLEILVDDLRTNPRRYVNLSVFGRKDKKGPITSPAKKDTIPGGGN